jgi:hypothetical protein
MGVIPSQQSKLYDRVDMSTVSDRWIWITRFEQDEIRKTDQKDWDDLRFKAEYRCSD